MKKIIKFLIALSLLTFSHQNLVLAQDFIEIDSSGVIVNGHDLGMLINDTLYQKYSVVNFRRIIKKPFKRGRKGTSEAIVKNNRCTRFFYHRSFEEVSEAPIIHFEQVYVSKKEITVKILDLIINSNTTYQDILKSNFFKLMLDDRIDSNVIMKPNSLFFENVLNSNINVLINVSDDPNSKVSIISVTFYDFMKIKTPLLN